MITVWTVEKLFSGNGDRILEENDKVRKAEKKYEIFDRQFRINVDENKKKWKKNLKR